jgi:hypothetical protein
MQIPFSVEQIGRSNWFSLVSDSPPGTSTHIPLCETGSSLQRKNCLLTLPIECHSPEQRERKGKRAIDDYYLQRESKGKQASARLH